MPQEFSLTPPEEKAGQGKPGQKLMSLGMPKRGPEDVSPFSVETDAEVGPDWRNALASWVQDHAYYPHQAALMHQQGTVRILVTTMPDGRVVSVDLERSSGSPWLDLALQGMFRGARLPSMPKSVGGDPVPFHFTMRYVLVP